MRFIVASTLVYMCYLSPFVSSYIRNIVYMHFVDLEPLELLGLSLTIFV